MRKSYQHSDQQIRIKEIINPFSTCKEDRESLASNKYEYEYGRLETNETNIEIV
jgi:hypothetical protein